MRRFALLIACIPLAHAADSTCSASNIEEIAKQFQQASKKHDRWRILEAAGELAERYELAGRRKSLRDLARRLEKKHWGDEMEPLRTQAKVFGGYADQTVASHAPSRLTYAYTDRKITVPLTINGTPANYLLDSGAPANTISAAEAKRLGLAVHDAPIVVGYVFNELKPGGIAMADDLAIGNLHLRNVLFQVAPEGLPGILGLPMMMAMETIRWNSNGWLEFGFAAGARDPAAANLCLFGRTPLVTGEIANRAAVFALDTGSDATLLFPRFARDFPETAKTAVPGNEAVFGDAVKDPQAKLIDEMFVRAGGLRLRAANAVLMSKDIAGPTPAHGLLGMDVLEQARSVTLDFAAMKMTVDGVDAAPIPPTAESACRLPPDFACANGSRCVVQTDEDDEICLLERLPREQWPGNPVIEDVIENGKRCALGENVTCPAGKSCRAVFQSNQSCALVIQDPVRVPEDATVAATSPVEASANARDIMQRVLKNDLFEIAPPRDYVFLEERETKHLNADDSVKEITSETREVINLYDAEYLGPRTAWAGFTSMTWPVTSQSNSMRSAVTCYFTVGAVNSPCSSFTKAATWTGCTSASWAMPFSSHHVAKRRVAFKYAFRVLSLLTWVVKNSRTRFAAFGAGVNRGAGCSAGAGERTISVLMQTS